MGWTHWWAVARPLGASLTGHRPCTRCLCDPCDQPLRRDRWTSRVARPALTAPLARRGLVTG
eukprot:3201785-Lingulodinium_polyedra.AAC.1